MTSRRVAAARVGGVVGLGALLVVAVLVLTGVQAGAMHYVGLVVPYVALVLIAAGAAGLIADLRVRDGSSGVSRPETGPSAKITPSDG